MSLWQSPSTDALLPRLFGHNATGHTEMRQVFDNMTDVQKTAAKDVWINVGKALAESEGYREGYPWRQKHEGYCTAQADMN